MVSTHRLFQEWAQLGGKVFVRQANDARHRPRSVEEILGETVAHVRNNSRLLWIALDWLIAHADRVDGERLLGASDASCLPVLGVLCDAARVRREHPLFNYVIARCPRNLSEEFFFQCVARSPLMRRLTLESPLEVFRRWNFICSELTYLSDPKQQRVKEEAMKIRLNIPPSTDGSDPMEPDLLRSFDGTELTRILEDIDRLLSRPTKVLVAGGAAMILGYADDDKTKDIDYAILEGDSDELRGAIRATAAEWGLEEDLMNDAAKGYYSILPPDYLTRARVWNHPMMHMEVVFPGRPEMLALKIIGLRAQDRSDLDLLLREVSDQEKRVLVGIMEYVAQFRPDWSLKIQYFLAELEGEHA